MDIQEILQTQSVNQITQEHITIMETMLAEGKRAEVYLYYSKLIGNNDPTAVGQLLMQAQITTYSGVIGGAALMGNFQAKENNPDLYNLSLDDFSKNIIEGMIGTIKSTITPDGNGHFGTGLLTADQIQKADQAVWISKQMGDDFPGNYQLSLDAWQPEGDFDTNPFFDALNAGNAGIAGAPLGRREDEFFDWDYRTVSHDGYTFKVNKDSGKIEGVFPESGTASFFNENIFNGGPSYTNSLIREELWKYMGANGKSGSSIYDLYEKFNAGEISQATLQEEVLYFFGRAQSAYGSYEDDILGLGVGEYVSVHNDVTGDHVYTRLSSGEVIEIGYFLRPSSQLEEVAHAMGWEVGEILGLGPNQYLEGRFIADEEGNRSYLFKEGDKVMITPQDNDAGYVAPKGYVLDEEGFATIGGNGEFIPVPVLRPANLLEEFSGAGYSGSNQGGGFDWNFGYDIWNSFSNWDDNLQLFTSTDGLFDFDLMDYKAGSLSDMLEMDLSIFGWEGEGAGLGDTGLWDDFELGNNPEWGIELVSLSDGFLEGYSFDGSSYTSASYQSPYISPNYNYSYSSGGWTHTYQGDAYTDSYHWGSINHETGQFSTGYSGGWGSFGFSGNNWGSGFRAPLKTRFQENNDGAGPDPKTAAYLEVREDLRSGKPRQGSLKVGFLEVPFSFPVGVGMDGDGIELEGLEGSQVFFNMDRDDFLENTAWIGADDGLLAIDLGGDGKIERAEEINFTLWDEGEVFFPGVRGGGIHLSSVSVPYV